MGAYLQQQVRRREVLVVTAEAAQHSFDQARVNPVGVSLQVIGETLVYRRPGVAQADYDHNLGYRFPGHLCSIGFPGSGVAVNIEQGVRVLTQQLQGGYPGAPVSAPVMGQMQPFQVQRRNTLLLQRFPESRSHGMNPPRAVDAVHTVSGDIRFRVMRMVDANPKREALPGQRPGGGGFPVTGGGSCSPPYPDLLRKGAGEGAGRKQSFDDRYY